MIFSQIYFGLFITTQAFVLGSFVDNHINDSVVSNPIDIVWPLVIIFCGISIASLVLCIFLISIHISNQHNLITEDDGSIKPNSKKCDRTLVECFIFVVLNISNCLGPVFFASIFLKANSENEILTAIQDNTWLKIIG